MAREQKGQLYWLALAAVCATSCEKTKPVTEPAPTPSQTSIVPSATPAVPTTVNYAKFKGDTLVSCYEQQVGGIDWPHPSSTLVHQPCNSLGKKALAVCDEADITLYAYETSEIESLSRVLKK